MLDMHDGLYLFLEVFNINDAQHYDTFHTGIQPKHITLNDNLYIYLERERERDNVMTLCTTTLD
jgi:hypothetical protein